MILISFALLLNLQFTMHVFSDKLCKVLAILMQGCKFYGRDTYLDFYQDIKTNCTAMSFCMYAIYFV